MLLLGLMSVGMLYCNSTSKDENQKEERISQRFIATDGTNAMVFFGKKEGKKYVEIQNNGKTIRVFISNPRMIAYSTQKMELL